MAKNERECRAILAMLKTTMDKAALNGDWAKAIQCLRQRSVELGNAMDQWCTGEWTDLIEG